MTSTERPQGTAPRELGPQRFQCVGHPDTNGGHERHVLRAIGAGLALLVLLAGVPIGLYMLGGLPPVPTSWPTRQDLVGVIGPELVLGVLLWVVWLAWLQFTLCVMVEMRSAVRGIGLPGRVPLAGGSQRFARVLVGSVLLAATSVGQASAAAAPTTGSGDVAVTAAEMATETAQVQQEQAERAEKNAREQAGERSSAADGETTYKLGDMTLEPDEAEGLVGKKVYVVQPPEGRYHDNMWDIAERTLGDGRRYPEIFNLNESREQPDGRELSLSRLIQPNWLLVVPDDAEGVDRVREIPSEPATSPGRSGSDGSAPTEHPGSSSQPAGERGPNQQPSQQPLDQADMPAAGAKGGATGAHDAGDPGVLGGLGNLAEDLLGAGLLAAGLLGAVDAVRRRRRTLEPGPEEVDAEVALRIGADPDRVTLLDTALRALTTAQNEQPGTGATLPAAYAAVVTDDYVELKISPPRTDAPAPWRIQEEGRSWVVRREDLTGTPADGPAPYPGLVSLGRDDTDRDVLLDLEAAGGPVSIVGEPSVATEVVTALAAELATNGWSDRLSVTGYGLPEELSVLARLQTAQSIDAVLPELHRRMQAGDEQDVLVGRLRGGPAAWSPEFLMLGAQPDPDELERLSALTAGGARTALGVVVAGQVPGARWTVHVNAVGDLEIPLLGLSVQANRLPGEHVASIAALVEPPEPERVEPGESGEVASQFLERPDLPRPAATATPAGAATADVVVSVLGNASVRAPGPMDAERLSLSTEIVVYLALHREGVHPTVLAAAIWPGGVTTNVREASVERVSSWLGTDSSGAPQLQQGTDGHLWLGPEVVVDLDVVTGLLQQSRQTSTATDERDALRAALRTARGPMLADRPRGRYAWMARVRLERATADVLVDAAHRLSVLCEHQPDPDSAADAARAGLRIRPGDQVLWRDLIRTAGGGPDGPDALSAIVAEMNHALAQLGEPRLEPETLALLEELAPGLVAEEPHPA